MSPSRAPNQSHRSASARPHVSGENSHLALCRRQISLAGGGTRAQQSTGRRATRERPLRTVSQCACARGSKTRQSAGATSSQSTVKFVAPANWKRGRPIGRPFPFESQFGSDQLERARSSRRKSHQESIGSNRRRRRRRCATISSCRVSKSVGLESHCGGAN